MLVLAQAARREAEAAGARLAVQLEAAREAAAQAQAEAKGKAEQLEGLKAELQQVWRERLVGIR